MFKNKKEVSIYFFKLVPKLVVIDHCANPVNDILGQNCIKMFLKSRIFNIPPKKLRKYAKNVVTNFCLIFVEKCDNLHNILNNSNLVSLRE